MNLGKIIETIQIAKRVGANQVCFDFRETLSAFSKGVPTVFHSYRGAYSDLAIGFHPNIESSSLDEFEIECRATDGRAFDGYKGGEFVMTKDTPVYVSQPGEASDCVIVDHRVDEGEDKTLVFIVEDLSI